MAPLRGVRTADGARDPGRRARTRVGGSLRISDYRAFTAELHERLAADARVVGLVALGSMSGLGRPPDEWSDHDFFVVVQDGVGEELRHDLSWLPRFDRVLLAYRDTEHGAKVVYDDGHLLEFAVFTLDELAFAHVNRYSVLLDRGEVAEAMARVRSQTADPSGAVDPARRFADLVTHVLVGAGRSRRGEELSAASFVKGLAVTDLLALLGGAVPSEHSDLLDDLDPARRFDEVHPGLAAEIGALLRAPTLDTALGLLELAERELRPRCPGLAWGALETVRARITSGENPAGEKRRAAA